MPTISALFRSLGNDGAVRNARAVLDARQREEWLVAGLASRLDGVEQTAVTAPASTSAA